MATRRGSPSSNGRNGTSRAVARRAQTAASNGSSARIAVRKTYKLYVGGAFPRSESGRSYVVSAADGTPLASREWKAERLALLGAGARSAYSTDRVRQLA